MNEVIGDAFCWIAEKIMAPLFMVIVVLALVALAAAGAFYGGKLVLGLGHDVHGKDYARVVSKAYTPDTQQTSTVPVATGKGVGVGVVTTGNPENFGTLLLMRGTVYSFNSKTLWALSEIGDTVVVHYKTNPQWSLELESVDFIPHAAE